MSDTNNIPSFGAMLRGALGDAIIADAGENFLDMCDEGIVFEFPFSPKGSVRELRGRDTMAAYLPKAGGLISFESMSPAVTHVAKDGETFVLEFSCKGKGEAGRYDQNYISVIEVKNGRITRYRDYWNPLVLLNAVGGVEVLKSKLGDFIDG
ncbi:nuclear transport factor 2 family protein [Ruegeria sp. 2205SS24-7]|uniref:nuclear transport factor 2 family protein n=1 Tax=Ruegeria discodermiae TaxID=3064389 RepID=UPI0027406D7F|nr:nuclear transport factor 2 family protein [Ruegeria sp. 2205SS24-7]MDP5220561.1 nuclear transport factor 2 family protein [Ruegeria sp. 2205SS24-7]